MISKRLAKPFLSRNDDMHPKLMTRMQLAAFLREQGFPIGNSTLHKLCSPAIGGGPPVARWWNKRPLYDPAMALKWVESQTRPGELNALD
jgi:hypothetical protein